jgi:hypothetical protein
MKFNSYAVFCIIFSLIVFASCNDAKKEQPVNEESNAGSDSVTQAVMKAAQSCLYNLAQAQAAADNAKTPELKTFAAYLKGQQQSVLDGLDSAASSRNISIADTLDRTRKKRIERIKLQSKEDEQRLLVRMGTEFRTQGNAFKYLASSGSSEWNNFATRSLSTVKSSLDTIHGFRKKFFRDTPMVKK